MRKKIMILGAGVYQKPLLQYAAQHYDVVVVAPRVDEETKALSSRQYLFDIRDTGNILAAAKTEKIDGIITDQTDIPVRTVSYVANELGLPANPYDVACIYTDKELMRKRQVDAGIPVLPHKTVETADEAAAYFEELGSDIIIKPLDNQGSRGVSAIRSKDELIVKFPEAKKYSSSGRVLLEKMAKGRQFAVEGVAINGEFKSLICSDDDYFHLGDCFAARSRVFTGMAFDEIHARVMRLNDEINKAFGIRQGLSHAEYIMDDDQIYLLEVGARGGGAYISSDTIPLVAGLRTDKFLCEMACGELSSSLDVHPSGLTVGYVAFYLPAGIVRSVRGIEEVQSLPYVHRNTLDSIVVGKQYGSPEDKTSRQLMVISASNRDEWDLRARQVEDQLQIAVENERKEIVSPIWH